MKKSWFFHTEFVDCNFSSIIQTLELPYGCKQHELKDMMDLHIDVANQSCQRTKTFFLHILHLTDWVALKRTLWLQRRREWIVFQSEMSALQPATLVKVHPCSSHTISNIIAKWCTCSPFLSPFISFKWSQIYLYPNSYTFTIFALTSGSGQWRASTFKQKRQSQILERHILSTRSEASPNSMKSCVNPICLKIYTFLTESRAVSDRIWMMTLS